MSDLASIPAQWRAVDKLDDVVRFMGTHMAALVFGSKDQLDDLAEHVLGSFPDLFRSYEIHNNWQGNRLYMFEMICGLWVELKVFNSTIWFEVQDE